jgi:hypothetical protein
VPIGVKLREVPHQLGAIHGAATSVVRYLIEALDRATIAVI